jgi:CRISPR-associated protein Cmr5
MSTVNTLKTLDQRRAKHAWDAVAAIVKGHVKTVNDKPVPDDLAKKFGGHARKLPLRIMASGLGQALAFLKAKNYAPELLKATGDWVLDKYANPASTRPQPDDDALLKEVINENSDFLRRATAETLAYLQWLTRFAEAEGLMESTAD